LIIAKLPWYFSFIQDDPEIYTKIYVHTVELSVNNHHQSPQSLLIPHSNIPLPMLMPSPQQPGMHQSPVQQQSPNIKSENLSPKELISQMPLQHLTNLPKSSPNGFINGQMSPFFGILSHSFLPLEYCFE
jgi:hypothetical protein